MNIAPEDTLTALRLTLNAQGYRPVPVSGPYINVPSAGKRPLMAKWQIHCLEASAEQIIAWKDTDPGSTNTGLLTGELCGIDIDVYDPALAKSIEECALNLLGPTKLRRVGRAPKVLLVYRSAEPIDKMQTKALLFTENPEEKPTRVEVLGRGQQFVAFGIHPETHQPYVWPNSSPLCTAFCEVREVQLHSLRRFIAEAESLIRAAGASTRSESKRLEAKGDIKERPTVGIKGKERPNLNNIAEALAHIPNDFDYDDWIKIGFALYHGLGEGGRELWQAWSASSPRNDPQLTAKKWPTFAQGRKITVATLFWHATQNGWRRIQSEQFEQGTARTAALSDLTEAFRANMSDDASIDEIGYSWPFRVAGNGVEKRIERTDRETGEVNIEWRWFCSFLEIVADTRSADGEEWGRLLSVKDRDNRAKNWAMPMSMLAGDGTAYRERLLSLGLVMAPGKFPRDALHEYISTANPNVKARCVSRVGWHLSAFVLNDRTMERSHA